MADALPRVAGKLTEHAPLAPLVWFKAGGAAQWLFEPKNLADLQHFLRDLEPDALLAPEQVGQRHLDVDELELEMPLRRVVVVEDCHGVG